MKKILFGIAMVIGMSLAVSCKCSQNQEVVAEETAVEAVDSVLACPDTLAVEAPEFDEDAVE